MSIFNKKLIGFKSRKERRDYNLQYKELKDRLNDQVKDYIQIKSEYRKLRDQEKVDEYTYLIRGAKARFLNAVVEFIGFCEWDTFFGENDIYWKQRFYIFCLRNIKTKIQRNGWVSLQ